jgi:hypothetical protein
MFTRFCQTMLFVACLSLPAASADDDLKVISSALNVNDLSALSGLDIYKCEFPATKGQKLRGSLYLTKEEGTEPVRILTQETEVQRDGTAVFRAIFLREDRKLASVFLSDEKNMEFKLQWSGVAGGGLNGIVSSPLKEVPKLKKALQIHDVPKKLTDGSYELFNLYRAEQTPDGLAPQFPRASLRVEIVK